MKEKKITELEHTSTVGPSSAFPISIDMGSYWQTFRTSMAVVKVFVLSGLDAIYASKTNAVLQNVPVFEDNTAAAELPTGKIYRTSSGQLMIKY